MEGKSVLFKKFAGIDCFDIEVNELDPDKLVEIIAAAEPTFVESPGGHQGSGMLPRREDAGASA